MEFNLADLFERVADTAPDRLALVAGDRRLTYAQLDERGQPGRARAARRRRAAPASTSGSTRYNRAEWVEAMLGCLQGPAGAGQRQLSLRRRGAALPLRQRRSRRAVLRVAVRASHRAGASRPRAAAPARSASTTAPAARDDTIDADDYEQRLAAASGDTRLRGPFARRPLHPLHRRHHGHAEGRDLAPGRHLLRRRWAAGTTAGPASSAPRLIEQSVAATPARHARARAAHARQRAVDDVQHLLRRRHGRAVDRPPLRRRRRSGSSSTSESVNTVSLVGDAMARPLVDALKDRPVPSSLFAIVSGGAILSPTIKTQIHELMPNGLVLDSFGASETGANGVVETPLRARSSTCRTRPRSIDDDHRPVAPGETGWLARRGHVPRRLLQGRGEDRGDLRRGRRPALGDPRRHGGARARRHHHGARPRLAEHQLRWREDLPRGGRVGAEEPPAPCSTRSSSASPTNAGASGSRPSCSSAPAIRRRSRSWSSTAAR